MTPTALRSTSPVATARAPRLGPPRSAGRVAVRIVLVLIAFAALGLGVRLFFVPVRVTADVAVSFSSDGASAEVYLGDRLLGTTPFSVDSTEFPLLPDDVEPSYEPNLISPRSIISALGYTVGLEDGLRVFGAPPGLPEGGKSGGLSGSTTLIRDPDAGSVQFVWARTVLRRPDDSLDLVVACVLVDEISGTRRGGLLRVRRGDEVTLDTGFGQRVLVPSGLPRWLLRRAHHDASAVVTVGGAYDTDSIEQVFGEGEWWLRRFPPGTDRLDDDLPTQKGGA